MKIPVIRFPGKGAWEAIPYTLDFKPWVAKGERIVPATIAVRVFEKGKDPDVDYIDAMLQSVALDDTTRLKVQVTVMGGSAAVATTPAGTYRFRVRVICESGSKYQGDGEFKIMEE